MPRDDLGQLQMPGNAYIQLRMPRDVSKLSKSQGAKTFIWVAKAAQGSNCPVYNRKSAAINFYNLQCSIEKLIMASYTAFFSFK